MKNTILFSLLFFTISLFSMDQGLAIKAIEENRVDFFSQRQLSPRVINEGHFLYKAVEHDRISIVEILLASGARADLADKFSKLTPLCYAVIKYSGENAQTLKTLLKRANPNGCDNEIIPLVEAAARNKLEFVRILLEAGAHPNRKNKLSLTPLHVAAEKGYEALTAMLLEQGADTSAQSIKAYSNKTPLNCALENSHLATALLLLEAGSYTTRNGVCLTDLKADIASAEELLLLKQVFTHLPITELVLSKSSSDFQKRMIETGEPVALCKKDIQAAYALACARSSILKMRALAPLFPKADCYLEEAQKKALLIAAARGNDNIFNELIAQLHPLDDSQLLEHLLLVATRNLHKNIIESLLSLNAPTRATVVFLSSRHNYYNEDTEHYYDELLARITSFVAPHAEAAASLLIAPHVVHGLMPNTVQG